MNKKLSDGALLMVILAAMLGGGKLVQEGRVESRELPVNIMVSAQPTAAPSNTMQNTTGWSVDVAGSTTKNISTQPSKPCKYHQTQSGKPIS